MWLLTAILVVSIERRWAKDSFDYCIPSNSSCWPSQSEWDDLKSKITGGKLHEIGDESKYDGICKAAGNDAFKIEDAGEGRCMQYHACSKKTCDTDSSWNIPEYSVEASVASDVIEAINFANRHNLQVVVKTSGHNYAGASMGNGALLIWMRNYEKYGNISANFTSCGESYDAAIKVGGGQVWDEIYKAVDTSYHIIGGGGLTVSAAGGWLMGGGLSASARQYGMGIDQVINFEIVLANGTKVIASQCENEDLFWALRGGGGGSFGVTTSVHYKLHTAKPFCEAYMYTTDFYEPYYDIKTVYKWIELLVDSIPTLDRRWGGYWTFNTGILYFEGTEDEIKSDAFYMRVDAMDNMEISLKCAATYFTVRGGPDDMTTDETGYDELNIASRLISCDDVRDDPDKVKDVFKWMVNNGYFTFNYIVGGKMMEVAENGTAVHPAMRKACFQMETFAENLIQKLRDEFPDSGAGFNHAARDEPEWETQFWGSNLPRLETLKKTYDPDNRFNCWHCVGYLDSSCGHLLASHLVLIMTMAAYLY